jgi:hypothetical protein
MMRFSFLKVGLQYKISLVLSLSYIYREVGHMTDCGGWGMAKEDLVAILRRLLQTDAYLDFLLQLDEADLRTLISLIRDRVDRAKH